MEALEKAALMCESMGADGYGTLAIACAIRDIQTQQSPQSDDVSVKNQVYDLPDDLYDSKDWKAGNLAVPTWETRESWEHQGSQPSQVLVKLWKAWNLEVPSLHRYVGNLGKL